MTCINDINSYQGKITTKQLVDLMKGKSVKSVYLSKEITSRHQGLLRGMQDSDIRRMIIKLLILGALEEVFVQMKRAGAGSGNISVYIQVYKNAVKIEKGKVRVYISKGLD